MANIFKQKFGISIGLVVKDRMGLFMENGLNYMEFRFDKTPDLDFGRNFVKEVKAEKEKYGFITRTCHLPFPEGYDLSVTDEEIRKQAVENLRLPREQTQSSQKKTKKSQQVVIPTKRQLKTIKKLLRIVSSAQCKEVSICSSQHTTTISIISQDSNLKLSIASNR